MAATFKSQCWLAQQNLKQKEKTQNKQSSDMVRKKQSEKICNNPQQPKKKNNKTFIYESILRQKKNYGNSKYFTMQKL